MAYEPERRGQQPDRRDLLAAGQGDDAPGDRADDGDHAPDRDERRVNREPRSGVELSGAGPGASGVSVLMAGLPVGSRVVVGRLVLSTSALLAPPAAPSPRSPCSRSPVVAGSARTGVYRRHRSSASADRVHPFPCMVRNRTGQVQGFMRSERWPCRAGGRSRRAAAARRAARHRQEHGAPTPATTKTSGIPTASPTGPATAIDTGMRPARRRSPGSTPAPAGGRAPGAAAACPR